MPYSTPKILVCRSPNCRLLIRDWPNCLSLKSLYTPSTHCLTLFTFADVLPQFFSQRSVPRCPCGPCSWFSAETSTVVHQTFFSHDPKHFVTMFRSLNSLEQREQSAAIPAWQHCVTKHFQTENENAYLPATTNVTRRRHGVSLMFRRRDTSVNIQAYICNYYRLTSFTYLLVACSIPS